LLETHPALSTYRGSASSHDAAIRAAWTWTERRLIQAGRRPWLVLSSDALHEVTLYRALATVLRDLSLNVGEPERFLALADHYDYEAAEGDTRPAGQAQLAWNRLRLTYDTDGDGVIGALEADAGKYPAARGW
jgi:hypothetical protein